MKNKTELSGAVGGGEDVGGGEFQDEAGADGSVVLDAKAAAVLSDDASGDGETEAGAAIFGGEMREKEFVFVLWGNAVAGVGDDNFDGIEIGFRTSFDGDIFNEGGFEGFGGVVNEIDDDAAEQWSVGANRGRMWREGCTERYAVETAGEDFDGFADDVVNVGGIKFGGRETDELGKFVDEGGKCANFAFDEPGRFLDEPSKFGIAGSGVAGLGAFFEVAREPLSR